MGNLLQDMKIEAIRLNAEGFLHDLAGDINEDYFNLLFEWEDVKFVFGQRRIWGNCRAESKVIRISYKVLGAGNTVDDQQLALEYLVTHELCHLNIRGHGRRFWRLVDENPISREGYRILHYGYVMPYTDGSINWR